MNTETAREHVFSVEELLLNRGVVVEEVPLSELDINDTTFSTHDAAEDDVQSLEESLHSDGQLDPIVVRRHEGRWQIVDGFRRVRAAVHLGWHKVKARRFDVLSAEQSALWAIRNVTIALPYADALEALAVRLEEASEHAAADIVRRYVPPASEEEVAPVESAQEETDGEVTIESLGEQTLEAFGAQSENVQLLQENWADVPEETREALRAHLRYYAEMLQFLEEEPAHQEDDAQELVEEGAEPETT